MFSLHVVVVSSLATVGVRGTTRSTKLLIVADRLPPKISWPLRVAAAKPTAPPKDSAVACSKFKATLSSYVSYRLGRRGPLLVPAEPILRTIVCLGFFVPVRVMMLVAQNLILLALFFQLLLERLDCRLKQLSTKHTHAHFRVKLIPPTAEIVGHGYQ